MRITRIAVILLLCTMLVSSFACGEDEEPLATPTPALIPTHTPTPTTELTPTSIQVIKPTVGNIPQGWYLLAEDPYGTYRDPDGTEWGLIEYTDPEDDDYVQIYYGGVPSELKGRETDSDALISQVVEWSNIFEPDETGTMVVAGHTAGFTKLYESDGDWYEMAIVCIVGSTCLDINTAYDATTEDEAQAMSIINSISIE